MPINKGFLDLRDLDEKCKIRFRAVKSSALEADFCGYRNIQIFNSEQFGDIQTMTNERGETFFVGKDVAEALGYSQPDKAVMRHTDEDDRMKCTVIDNIGRKQNMYVINVNKKKQE